MLHTLNLCFRDNSVGDSGAWALAVLREAPLRHPLTFYFWPNSVGGSGGQALAALREAPSLHTLTIHLDIQLVSARRLH